MSRLILIPLALVLLLVLAAALLVTLLLDEEKVLELAAATLYEETGATLNVSGDTNLSLFPTIGVALEGATLTMPGEEQPGIKARALKIGVQLMPLLSGNVEIDTISVDGLSAKITSAAETPAVDTSKLNDKQLDAFYAQRRQAMAAAGDTAGAEAVLAVPLAMNVKHLIVTDSRMEMIDAASGESSVIELTKLEATGLNLDGIPVPVELNIRLPGEQPVELSLDGNIRIDQAAQALVLEGIEVLISGASAEPLQLQTQGEVDLSRQIADLQLTLQLGATRGEGKLRYASFESPQIDTNLALNLFNPALLALAGPSAAGATPAQTTPAETGDEPLPLDAIRLIDTRADLTIEQAVFGVHTINNMHIKMRALEGVVQIPTLTGALHGGQLKMNATFNGKHNTASLTTAGGLTAMDIATALTAMESEPILTGAANLDWNLNGKGRTANELVTALHGPIKLATKEVILKGIGVEKMLCQAVALVNQERLTASFPSDSRFQALGADLALADGKISLSPLRAELPQVTLTGTGALDLLSQDFKTTFKARLSPELEALDPACQVSKRLTSIDWPVKCKGQISGDPAKWCGVDTGDIIEDLTRNEAERKVKKKAGKLIDKFFKK